FLVRERADADETDEQGRAWFKIDAATGERSPYLSKERYAATIGKEIDQDRRPNNRSNVTTLCYTSDLASIVYRKDGDLYFQDLQEGEPRRLTDAPGDERFPVLSPDDRRVAYVRNHNVYVLDLDTGAEKAVTTDGLPEQRYGTTDWVHDEELGMLRGLFWCPDSRSLAFYRFDTRQVPRIPMVDYLPLHKKLKMLEYPKPGDPEALVEILVADVETGGSILVNTGEPKSRYLPRVGFLPDEKTIWVLKLDKDMETQTLLFADMVKGTTEEIKKEHCESWVTPLDPVRFMKDGRFLWQSARTGFNQLYFCDQKGEVINTVTASDSYGVSDIEHVDEDAGWIYFTASGPCAAEQHLFKVRLDGTELTRITEAAGTHDINLSPQGTYFVDSFSTFMQPTRQEVYGIDGKITFILNDNEDPELSLYNLGTPEFLKISTSDGVTLNALLLKPGNFDSTRKYPVICSTYGGPGSQTVQDRWGGVSRLWAHMLTQKGFLVFWLDHRGSRDHGHRGASLMHRELCTIEWTDQVEGINYLKTLPYVAGDRIGVWGWSYGGTTSVTCLLKAPEVFKAAVAVAPVLDFANYDSIYTERYMDTPEENPEGYKGTRLSEYVDNLKGRLLLIHGLQDDNVLVQNTFQLAYALQLANKPFEMMIYPEGDHGIGDAHIRVHLYDMITRFFEENL
ncbi:MAG: DPP IV N-terminal domain-containing protein, partial [Planctomycetes bacterium]|nr:DPP IV N-terminal domain-containing protein [Planctomycetota bacterium]